MEETNLTLEELLAENELLKAENGKLKKSNKKAVKKFQLEKSLKPYQAELIQMQNYLEETGKKMIILFEGR